MAHVIGLIFGGAIILAVLYGIYRALLGERLDEAASNRRAAAQAAVDERKKAQQRLDQEAQRTTSAQPNPKLRDIATRHGEKK